jgi:UDP-3-O-[3-hydroxymyristoyl] glucosamine N-acyltransferase
MKLGEIARLLGGEVSGDPETGILRLSKIEEAGEGEITFLANPKYAKFLARTAASAVIVTRGQDLPDLTGRLSPLNLVLVPDAYQAFLRLIDHFHPAPQPLPPGVHPTALISPGARLGTGCAIGPYAVIGAACVIGDRTSIHAGVVLLEGVQVGSDSILYSNVTVREQCLIGDRVIVQPGAVIGSDGFGFAPKPDGSYEKIPQRGIVVVEDDVEIGANTTIDRATIGETRIGKGTKLDNLIQVAHNVIIGQNTVMASQSGISGSTRLGDGCVIAGQVGFAGHLRIADRTTVGAKSGLGKDITEPGKTYFGIPVKEHHQAFRIEAVIRQLPDLLREIQALGKRVRELEERDRTSTPNTSKDN